MAARARYGARCASPAPRPVHASGRDASRLLASASLAVQRALGVAAEPLLVAPDADALLAAASEASIVVVGLTERWRRQGLGPARTALATRARVPALLRPPRHAPERARAGGERDALHLDARRALIRDSSEPPASVKRRARRSPGRRGTDRVPTGGAEHASPRDRCSLRRLRDRPRDRRSRRRRDLPGLGQADHRRRGGRPLHDARRPHRRLGHHVVRGAGRSRRCIRGRGTELFEGCLDRRRDRSCKGDPSGTLSFTFEYWALFASPDPASLVWGACWHPIVSGTGDFAGAQGVIAMVDTPTPSGVDDATTSDVTLALSTGARNARRRACLGRWLRGPALAVLRGGPAGARAARPASACTPHGR